MTVNDQVREDIDEFAGMAFDAIHELQDTVRKLRDDLEEKDRELAYAEHCAEGLRKKLQDAEASGR